MLSLASVLLSVSRLRRGERRGKAPRSSLFFKPRVRAAASRSMPHAGSKAKALLLDSAHGQCGPSCRVGRELRAGRALAAPRAGSRPLTPTTRRIVFTCLRLSGLRRVRARTTSGFASRQGRRPRNRDTEPSWWSWPMRSSHAALFGAAHFVQARYRSVHAAGSGNACVSGRNLPDKPKSRSKPRVDSLACRSGQPWNLRGPRSHSVKDAAL